MTNRILSVLVRNHSLVPAEAARARVAVFPSAWTDVATRWQPLWVSTAPPEALLLFDRQGRRIRDGART